MSAVRGMPGSLYLRDAVLLHFVKFSVVLLS